jgi:arabinoxylan arabinofuranohydrolase
MNSLKTTVFSGLTVAIFLFNSLGLFGQNVKPKDAKGASELKVVNNPIISNLGVCDPHIHIFNNKAYLFASHDRNPNDKFYSMHDWWVWSSSDLVNWKMEFNLFPKDMWVGATNNSWAVDGAERNGKHYFYVSGNWKTGVAVSTTGPGGPYKDALGKYIDKMSYDPTIFIDDDANKTPYLITDHFPYKIARLNEDMISLAEEPKELTHTTVAWKGDGGNLHKHNGIYYLNGHGTSYSTATNIYGPYTYRGTFYFKWVDHPMVFSWNNQTFCTFGTGDVGRLFRKTHLTYAHYKANGEIATSKEVGESFIGVGQYDCAKKIQAEWYFAASDGTKKQELDAEFVVNMTDNASLYFQRVLNMTANATISVQVASATKDGVVEVRQDKADGKLLGKIDVPTTGDLSTYKTVSAKLTNSEGLNNVYLVYKGKAGTSVNIDWLTISSTGAIVAPPKGEPIILAANVTPNTPSVSAYKQIEAEDLVCYHVLRTSSANDNGPSKHLSNMHNMSYSSYLLDFGSEAKDSLTFQARLSAVKSGSIELRLDSITGPLIGNCAYDSTATEKSYVTKEYKVKNPTGVKHVFLLYKMEEDAKYHNSAKSFNLNWIKFVK